MRHHLFLLLLFLPLFSPAFATGIPAEEAKERLLIESEQSDRINLRYLHNWSASSVDQEEDHRLAAEYAKATGMSDSDDIHLSANQVFRHLAHRDKLDIHDQAALTLPANWSILAQPHAAVFLRNALGIYPNNREQAVLFFDTPEAEYASSEFSPKPFAQVLYNPIGHIDDNHLTAFDLINLAQRIKQPIFEDRSRIHDRLDTEWIIKPSYNATTHQLTWGIKTSETKDSGTIVNSYVYAGVATLGRTSVISIISDLQNAKPEQITVLMNALTEAAKRLEFYPGHRYTDYRPGDAMAIDDPDILMTPPLLPPATDSPNIFMEDTTLLFLLFFAGFCMTIALTAKMRNSLRETADSTATRTILFLGLAMALCSLLALAYFVARTMPLFLFQALLAFTALLGTIIGIFIVCRIVLAVTIRLTKNLIGSEQRAETIRNNISSALILLGVVAVVARIAVVAMAPSTNDAAHAQHLRDNLTRYEATRITADFSNNNPNRKRGNLDHKQALQQTLATLSPIVGSFGKTITIHSRGRSTSTTEHDIEPGYYHWDGDKLVIVLSRVVLPATVQKINDMFHASQGDASLNDAQVTVEPEVGFSPWYAFGSYTAINEF